MGCICDRDDADSKVCFVCLGREAEVPFMPPDVIDTMDRDQLRGEVRMLRSQIFQLQRALQEQWVESQRFRKALLAAIKG